MKIGLLLIATGKYDVFLQPLIDSVDKYFFRGDQVTIYLFTDKNPTLIFSDRINLVIIPTEHKPFPYATLYRYKYFTQSADKMEAEYLFYCDVDMLFVDEVGREILGNIVCTEHPGFYKGGWGSPNCHKMSMAYLGVEMRNKYVCGGFQGGERLSYLAACETLASRIQTDEDQGIMAEWHDETHWNWFIAMRAKNIKMLNPSYCYPERWTLPFPKKLLALDKNHKEIRS